MAGADERARQVREVNSDRFQTILRYHESHSYNHSPFGDNAVYDLICMVQREGLALDSLAAELASLKDALEERQSGEDYEIVRLQRLLLDLVGVEGEPLNIPEGDGVLMLNVKRGAFVRAREALRGLA